MMRNTVCALGAILCLLPMAGCGGGGGAEGPTLSEQYKQALTLVNPESRATQLVNVALKQETAGDAIGAETSVTAAFEACAEIEDPIGRAGAFNRVAAAQGKLYLPGEAKDSLREVRDLAAEIESSEQKAILYAAMAVTYGKHLRDDDNAERYMKKAQTAVEEMDDPTGKLNAMLSVARSCAELELTGRADAAVQSALELAKSQEDARARANAITSIATALAEMNQAAKATATFDEAVEAAGAIDDPLSKAHALTDIAGFMIDAGSKGKAQATLMAANATADKIEDASLKAEVREKINQRQGRL